MHITVITAFPEFLRTFFATSIVGKGVEKGLLSVEVVDIRDYARGAYRQIDDYAFGGGGMLLMAEPLAEALEDVHSRKGKAYVLGTSPQGAVLQQDMVETLAEKDHLLIVCGHYEGMDERFVQKYVDMEVSLGDYVLTGGELAAMVIADSVSRRIPGVVGKESAVEEDSFARGFLDHPHYTRPATWEDMPVPEELLSGDHAKILAWRRQEAVQRTLSRRPEVLGRAGILPYMSGGAYLALVLENEQEPFPENLLERSLHLGAQYGLERTCCISSRGNYRTLAGNLKDRGALKVFGNLRRCRDWIARREKRPPLVINIGEIFENDVPRAHTLEVKRSLLERQLPALFVFFQGNPQKKPTEYDCALFPLRGGYGQTGDFSPEDRLAIVLDRFFGCR
ncbi:MAG TPA: tRNA (guanosine(37)-N1)-methyltransferase TrmD [Synergistaceae bacterium]|nr:tRNA (guanosine(37)-N1)-methyltransferase TrmD [Synergistaceae bacterium]HPQ36148.1 tRNA (guanosine(37)-N1)-methyltransferase TrmD [Synergistaceae bacterium]